MWFRRLCLVAVIGAALSACQFAGPIGNGPSVEEGDFADIPVADFRAAAREIERQVHEGIREPVLENQGQVVVDTPEIRQAVRTRAARIDLLNRFLDAGYGWERRNGRVWVLRSDDYKASTTRRQRDLDAIMVNGENQDRWTLYEGVIDANGWPQRTLSAVELVFFQERLSYMPAGQKYEDANGEVAFVE